jgi:hypothetical protein
MLTIALRYLPYGAQRAFWVRYQCPAYDQPEALDQWRCIRRRHRRGWHRDARGVQWPGERMNG